MNEAENESTSQFHFNLLDEPWIPVIDLDGNARIISIRETLYHAARYRRISATLPHTNAAVLRLLLAILHRNFGPNGYEEWGAVWNRGEFDSDILEDYFSQWGKRFDLFSEDHPFYQQRHPLVRNKPIQTLMQMVGGGDTFTLFDHILDDTPVAFSPAEAALGLITTQNFALAGLALPQYNLVYTDAPCSRAAVFILEGMTLFETLMFNLIRYNRSTPFKQNDEKPDCPAWEMENPYLPERSVPLGYLDYLTWQNRMIQLIPSKKDGRVVVESMTTAPGLKLEGEIHNPMYHYRKAPAQKGKPDSIRVLRFNEGRALWRDSYALLDLQNQTIEAPHALGWMADLFREGILPHRRLQVCAYGMCTEPGKAKVYFYRGEGFEISDELLCDENRLATLGTALAHSEGVRSEIWQTLSKLARNYLAGQTNPENGHEPAPEDVQKLVQHWEGEGIYWNMLERPFYQFLDSLPDEPEAALKSWDESIKKSAWSAYRRIVTGLGDNQKALKAAAQTNGRLAFGIQRILEPQAQEA